MAVTLDRWYDSPGYLSDGENCCMKKPKNDRPGEVIGEWLYFYGPEGDLHRARITDPPDSRRSEFVVPAANAEFALRCARMSAGLPEYGA